jgi:pyocin large subunit-like protein
VTWGNPGSLADHFTRHGADFQARDAEDYAAKAWAFRQRALAGGLQMKLDGDGVLRVFDPATGAFAAYNRDGTAKTYFKPGSRDYFARQPGKPVTPRDLPQR